MTLLSPSDLEYHRAVTTCLSYTAAAIEQQRALSEWDTGNAIITMQPGPYCLLF